MNDDEYREARANWQAAIELMDGSLKDLCQARFHLWQIPEGFPVASMYGDVLFNINSMLTGIKRDLKDELKEFEKQMEE